MKLAAAFLLPLGLGAACLAGAGCGSGPHEVAAGRDAGSPATLANARTREPAPSEPAGPQPLGLPRDEVAAGLHAEVAPPARAGEEEPPTVDRPTALDRLRDPDPEVRASAAEWFFLDPRSFSELSDLLRNDPSAAVRVSAAGTLGDAMNSPEEREAVDLLLAALHDDEPAVVVAALDALEWVGDAGIVPRLGFLLEHPEPRVRAAAAEAIAFLDD